MKPLNVFIAVRSPILSDGISRILASEAEMEVKKVIKDIDELSSLPEEQSCSLILDINLADSDEIRTINKLTQNYTNLLILAIGEDEESNNIKKIIQAGASGYICKNQDSDELIEAIKKINRGDLYLSDKAIRKLYNKSDGTSKNHAVSANLTERESEILALICQELTNREIADKLSISVRTVDAHRRNILQKTGAKNTAGLVKYAIRNQIFPLKR